VFAICNKLLALAEDFHGLVMTFCNVAFAFETYFRWLPIGCAIEQEPFCRSRPRPRACAPEQLFCQRRHPIRDLVSLAINVDCSQTGA
jgi:hypothetical protein